MKFPLHVPYGDRVTKELTKNSFDIPNIWFNHLITISTRHFRGYKTLIIINNKIAF